MPEPSFESLSVILPVINEAESLLRTIEILEAEVSVGDYVLVVCERTLPASRKVCQELAGRDAARFCVKQQTLPFLGGAIREGFGQARGSHVVMMASDLETDPHTVRPMVAVARQNPTAIVTASRWTNGGDFQGYGAAKLLANRLFQRIFSSLYGVRLTDMSYGYRLFPTALVQQIQWRELKHPFLLETLVRPLRAGVRVIEVPSSWRARVEGVSQGSLWNGFGYWRVGLAHRLRAPEKFAVA